MRFKYMSSIYVNRGNLRAVSVWRLRVCRGVIKQVLLSFVHILYSDKILNTAKWDSKFEKSVECCGALYIVSC